VDRVLLKPPRATAQILHPERYLRGVAPLDVALGAPAAALGADWRETRQGVLGELDHRLLVQRYLDAAVAARAAEGWAGASYALLESDAGEVAILIRSRWDDAGEAREWLDVYAETVRARFGDGLVSLETRPGWSLWRTPEGALLLGGDGAETVLAMAPTPAQASRLAEPAAGMAALWLDPARALFRFPAVTTRWR